MKILNRSHTAGRLKKPASAVYRAALLSAVISCTVMTGCKSKENTDAGSAAKTTDQISGEQQSFDTATAAELSETVTDDKTQDTTGMVDGVTGSEEEGTASEEGIIINIVTDSDRADSAGSTDSLADETDEDNGSSTGKSGSAKEKAAGDKSGSFITDLRDIPAGTVLDAGSIDTANLSKYFSVSDIEEGDSVFERINGKSYRANDYVPLSSLVYLKLPHYNFDGDIQVGELIVCRDIADDVVKVFTELFEARYQIQSMYLIDNYWTGDPDTTDSASIDVNNTSCFCFRNATAGSNLSNHAYGRAIDLNPQQNPYVSYKTGSPVWSHSNADAYIDRSTGLPHVITHEDTAYKIFTKYGFGWGGDWNSPKDYQHFEKKR